MRTIKAIKNGHVKEFTLRQWDIIGTDKYGWVIVPDVPKEVKQIVEQEVATIKESLTVQQEVEAAPKPAKHRKK